MNKLLLLIVIISLTLIGCKQEETVYKEVIKPVKTIQVKRTSGILKLKHPGTVRASKRAELSFDVPGRIVMLNAKEGARIKKGDIIAELDNSDYKNNYQSAKANLKEAKLSLDRYQKLFKQKAIAKASLDKVEKAYDIAEANMKVAEKALNDTKLKAYFSGSISARYVENYQNIQAKQSIISIEDKSTLEIVIHVSEEILAKTNKEDMLSKYALSMYASFDTIPNKKFDLKIKEISTKVDPATRTYALVLTMSATKKYNILSGMTATVTTEISAGKKAGIGMILVPVTSIMGDKKNNSYSWIYSEETSTVMKRKVVIGEMSGSHVYILSGINIGDTIVTAGINYLVDGMKVRLLTGKIGE